MHILRTLLFSLLLPALPTAAQHVTFTFGGGLASHYGGAQYVGAYKAGVGYEVELSQRLTFTPRLEVYGKGWKDPNQRVAVFDKDGNPVLDEAGNLRTGIKNRSATANYLEVPLLLSYYVRTGERRYIVVAAGPFVAYGLTGKQKTKGDTSQEGAEQFFYEKKTFNEPGSHRLDYGLRAMAGYEFANGVTLGLEGDFSLGKFNTAGDRNVAALVTIGYKLR